MIRVAQFILIMYQVGATLYYPSGQANRYQWRREGSWVNCQTQQVILGQNCDQSGSSIRECYAIPSEGLCSKAITSSQSSQSSSWSAILDFQVSYSQPITAIHVKLNTVAVETITLQAEQRTLAKSVTLAMTATNVIQLLPEGSGSVYLEQGLVQDTTSPNCIISNSQTHICDNHGIDAYSDTCVSQFKEVITMQMQSTINKVGTSIVLKFESLLTTIGNCVDFKVFMYQNYYETKPTYFISANDIDLQDNTITVTMDQALIDNHCISILSEYIVGHQCYVGLASTYDTYVYFRFLSEVRILTHKPTQESELTIFGFEENLSCCALVYPQVLTSLTITDIKSRSSGLIFTLVLRNEDPSLAGSELLIDGYIYTDNEPIFMTLLTQTALTDQSIMFKLYLPLQSSYVKPKVGLSGNIKLKNPFANQQIATRSIRYQISKTVTLTPAQVSVCANPETDTPIPDTTPATVTTSQPSVTSSSEVTTLSTPEESTTTSIPTTSAVSTTSVGQSSQESLNSPETIGSNSIESQPSQLASSTLSNDELTNYSKSHESQSSAADSPDFTYLIAPIVFGVLLFFALQCSFYYCYRQYKIKDQKPAYSPASIEKEQPKAHSPDEERPDDVKIETNSRYCKVSMAAKPIKHISGDKSTPEYESIDAAPKETVH